MSILLLVLHQRWWMSGVWKKTVKLQCSGFTVSRQGNSVAGGQPFKDEPQGHSLESKSPFEWGGVSDTAVIRRPKGWVGPGALPTPSHGGSISQVHSSAFTHKAGSLPLTCQPSSQH